ncbi:MAG: DUF296 domain-containing protein, partial [Oscillospiraceae bacterium]
MGNIHELIVGRDQDIKEAISTFMLEKGWESAYISGAIGSVKELVFTTPIGMDLPIQTQSTNCTGPAELLSFIGEIMKSELMDPELSSVYKDLGPLFIHIHASVAVTGGHVYGGGFKSGKTFRS